MDISAIESALNVMDEAAGKGEMPERFIEILDNSREVIIGGNKEGLIRLALEFVRPAQREGAGAHTHVDSHSIADVAQR